MEGKFELVKANPVPQLKVGDIVYRGDRYSIGKFTVIRVTPKHAILKHAEYGNENRCLRDGCNSMIDRSNYCFQYQSIGDKYSNYRAGDDDIAAKYETQRLNTIASRSVGRLQVIFNHLSVPNYDPLKEAFDGATTALTDLLENLKPSKKLTDIKQ